jgi:hypothetical protein
LPLDHRLRSHRTFHPNFARFSRHGDCNYWESPGGHDFANATGCKGRHANTHTQNKEQAMNNRLFWAFLWVIGLPLPLVIILYMLFGHHG